MHYVEQLKALLKALYDHKVDYILVGGAALNVHGLVRATQDVDLFIAPQPDNIERLKNALRVIWDDSCIDEITSEDLCGDYPAVRYGPPSGELYLDILTRLGEAFSYQDLASEEIELDGIMVRVATPKTLYDMKKDTVRPIDRADVLALKRAFGIKEPSNAD